MIRDISTEPGSSSVVQLPHLIFPGGSRSAFPGTKTANLADSRLILVGYDLRRVNHIEIDDQGGCTDGRVNFFWPLWERRCLRCRKAGPRLGWVNVAVPGTSGVS